MSYAILRVAKVKTAGQLAHSLKHSFRERDTPNADTERTPENSFHGAKSSAQAMAIWRQKMPEKHRKDAVVCLEYLVTGTPEQMLKLSEEQRKAYFDDALKWLKKRHGEENYICSGIHRDESNDHMYVYVIPKIEGKLNAKKAVGNRADLAKMQTDFADEVGKQYGFERGVERSMAKHIPMKSVYALHQILEKGMPKLFVDKPEKGLFRKPEEIAKEAVRQFWSRLKPYVEALEEAHGRAEIEAKLAAQKTKILTAERREKNNYKEVLLSISSYVRDKSLTPEQRVSGLLEYFDKNQKALGITSEKKRQSRRDRDKGIER